MWGAGGALKWGTTSGEGGFRCIPRLIERSQGNQRKAESRTIGESRDGWGNGGH